jgi:hypothetical protein
MNILNQYLKGKDRKKFAEDIGTTVHVINNLCSNGKAKPGKRLAIRIQEVTHGEIMAMELLYPESQTGKGAEKQM